MSVEWRSLKKQALQITEKAIERGLKKLASKTERNARLKANYEYLGVISGQTRNTTLAVVNGLTMSLGLGTWWGAAYNVKGGFSKIEHESVSEGYKKDQRRRRKSRGREAAWKGRGAYRPFLVDAMLEEAPKLRGYLKQELK